jgi:hypothetical protein
MGVAFLQPFFNFLDPGEMPLGGPNVVYNYCSDTSVALQIDTGSVELSF